MSKRQTTTPRRTQPHWGLFSASTNRPFIEPNVFYGFRLGHIPGVFTSYREPKPHYVGIRSNFIRFKKPAKRRARMFLKCSRWGNLRSLFQFKSSMPTIPRLFPLEQQGGESIPIAPIVPISLCGGQLLRSLRHPTGWGLLAPPTTREKSARTSLNSSGSPRTPRGMHPRPPAASISSPKVALRTSVLGQRDLGSGYNKPIFSELDNSFRMHTDSNYCLSPFVPSDPLWRPKRRSFPRFSRDPRRPCFDSLQSAGQRVILKLSASACRESHATAPAAFPHGIGYLFFFSRCRHLELFI